MSSASNELILTSSPDGPIIGYDIATGTAIAVFYGSRSPSRGLTMAGQRLVAVSHVSSDTFEGSINIYNWHKTTPFLNFPVPELVAPLIATLDGAFLFAGGVLGSILSLCASSGDVIRKIVAHQKAVSCLLLSDDGSLVISGSEDGTIVVVPTFMIVVGASSGDDDLEEDLILHKWKAHSDSVTALKSGMIDTLVSCSVDCTCKFWNFSGVLMRTVEFPCAIFGVVLDLEGSAFYAGGADGFVYKGVENVASKKQLQEVNALSVSHGVSIVSLVLLNEGSNLVSAAEDGSVWVWDVEKGEVIKVLGNKMIGTSDMIVGKRSGVFKKGNNVANGEDSDDGLFTSFGLCDEEMIKTLKQITELGQIGDLVIQDRKRAIDMLESAIEMYERLLRLILKEATKAIEEEDDEDQDEEEQRKHDGKERQ